MKPSVILYKTLPDDLLQRLEGALFRHSGEKPAAGDRFAAR